ncbi:unnamed protein product [Acanthoscelides obtectus]|uniref:Uncharacterized protein n=1 Tax=Acanthoscelides obtectus TaxID=200917 RepID=A0A9P0Q5J3_ACAOB|nr:unnamed protein product [Acanthoscelides obtectus]CAK1669053.1 hypothetical protein AOBTE_LOCUS26762 [Acanthoscelides obtectus]
MVLLLKNYFSKKLIYNLIYSVNKKYSEKTKQQKKLLCHPYIQTDPNELKISDNYRSWRIIPQHTDLPDINF